MVFNSGPPHLNHPFPRRLAQEFSKAHENLKKYICKKKRKKKKENLTVSISETPKPNGKTIDERKKKKKRKGEARQRKWYHAVTPWRCRPHPRERDPSCYPVPTMPSVVAYPNWRPIMPLPPVARSALPSPTLLLHCSSLHSSQVFNLSFPSKPNIMFVNLRI